MFPSGCHIIVEVRLFSRIFMNIDVGKYEFVLEAVDPIILPSFKGSTLRGAFGSVFRRVVCIVRDKECAECLLKSRCVYSYIFETPPPPDTKVMRKYEAAPHPFVIEPPAESRRGYKPGDEIAFGLTLIGRAVDYLPYFIHTFDEMGRTGLGKGRGHFTLKKVNSLELDGNTNSAGQTLYSAETGVLSDTGKDVLPLGPVLFEGGPCITSQVKLDFKTPTRISYNGRLTENVEFHIIIRNLLRRMSLLSYFHGNAQERQEYDYKKIIEKAGNVRTIARRIRHYDWERYSGRQEQKINMGGFVGGITFEGEIEPFMPLLKAGEILHIGKGTVFGMGQYVVRIQLYKCQEVIISA